MPWFATVYPSGLNPNPVQNGELGEVDAFLRIVTAPLPAALANVDDKRHLPAWGPYRLAEGATRSDAGVIELSALVLDYDEGDGDDAVSALSSAGWALGWYTSFSHTDVRPKYRVILPLAAPVPAHLWRAFWRREVPKLPGKPDGQCKDISRQYFAYAQRSEAHDSGVFSGVLWPVDLAGLDVEAPSAPAVVAGAAPDPGSLAPEVSAWLQGLAEGEGGLEGADLAALAQGAPYGGPGAWQKANQRILPRLANAWTGWRGSPPSAEELWAIAARCVPPDHDDDTWRFCVTLAASRAVVVEVEEGDDNAPSGGGVPDPEIWALVRAPLPKGGWRVPPERDVVRTILEKDPRWAGRIKYDTLQYRAVIDGKPPDDDYLAAVAAWLFRVYNIKTLSKDIVLDGLTLAARATPIDPVVAWLDDLPEWDGTPRLDTWIARYGRGVGDPDLLARYGRGFFVGLVARQYRPEVQADNVLTLWGEQGARKSTLLRSVVPEPDWFSDSRIDLEDPKRLSASLSGKVLVEWPELSAIRRSDAETVKSFLTSQRDRYVPMYGRVEVVRPRRVIFAATLNKNNAVPEAGRRWWVVEIAGTCDIDGLLSCRTQLWAEARAAYRAGATWHLPPEWEARQGRDVARFAVSDDWLELVRAYTAGGPKGGPKHLLDLGAIILRGGQVRNRADEARLQLALRQCGWSRDGALWSPP